MAEQPHPSPGLATLLRRVAVTGLGALQNRFELLAVEWQEERVRLAEMLSWVVGFLFLGIMATLLFTITIIFLFPEGQRLYVAAGFTVLYLAGAVVAWFGLRTRLKQDPFPETLNQIEKDRVWLDSLK